MNPISKKRLLVLGFDGMDVELVRSWAAAGYLPTFRRLLERFAWTDYVDPPEHLSGTIWTSINTGLGPLRHDFYFFTRYVGGSYRMRLARADDLKSDCFWKWFAQSGFRLTLADVPLFKPDPEYGGKQLLGWGQHDLPWKTPSVPRGLLSSLSTRFGTHPVPYCHNYSAETDSLLDFRSGLLIGIERRTALLKSLIGAPDWDLFYGVYSEPHCAGHLMWHLEDASHPWHSQEQLGIVGHALRDIYAAIDRGLGELMATADTNTTCVLFFSHGMGPNYHGDHLFPEFVDRFNHQWTGESSDLGKGNGRCGMFDFVWRSSVGRIPLASRSCVKQRLPMHLRGWITTKRQQNPRVWSQMPGFSLPMDVFSSLRVNLLGREPQGRIAPGDEYRRYLDAFTAELSQLINIDTGETAVERVFRADKHHDPSTIGSCPDLIVWWRKTAPIRGIRSARLGPIAGDFTDIRSGEHVMRGMLLLSHPRAKQGRHAIAGMKGLDISPTLCELAGVKPATRLDGTSRVRELLAISTGSHSACVRSPGSSFVRA